MDDSGTFTWHAGSILPYASLWHTVLRMCALNQLRPGNLPTTGAGRAAAIDPLDNGDQIDLVTLARWIGEDPAVFRWTHLGALPFWLRAALIAPHPRVCLACLSAGYHAALYSVLLLEKCPIHGLPLANRCYCGHPFSAKLGPADAYWSAGNCRCGRLRFFTRETCRRPTLPPAFTRALDPVADWLAALSRLVHPVAFDHGLRDYEPDCLRFLLAASVQLGLAYPQCFRPASMDSIPFVKAHFIGEYRSRAPAGHSAHRANARLQRRSEREYGAATIAYRAMARHLRRHVVPDSGRWVARFIASADPLAIADMLRTHQQALLAFTELIWARSIEPNVDGRRWPNRRPSGNFAIGLSDAIWANHQLSNPEGCEISLGTEGWLLSHAASTTLRAAWRSAQARAVAALRSGVADWRDEPLEPLWHDGAWAALVSPSGCNFLETPRPSGSWSTCDRPRKAARCATASADRQTRLDTMWASCKGACLTWTDAIGWHVIDAVMPADSDIRRQRLLGLPNQRPRFWLYRALDGQYVARLQGVRLQVVADSPRAAIASLRRQVSAYRRIYPADAAERSSGPATRVALSETSEMLKYQYRVACVRCERGFWRGAGELVLAAIEYRRRALGASIGVGTDEPGDRHNFS